jgi:7-cyano-7-deazaguanine reductase
MTQELNQEAVISIASKHLGKVGGEGYKDTYDPSLLVEIPRYLNREAYGIKEDNLPFVGGDVWNAYEVSAITNKGLPVVGMLKIYYSADSKYHVESKSIKLYLNSFNMTKMGDTAEECINILKERVAKDLSEKLQTEVSVEMFTETPEKEYTFENFSRIQNEVNLDNVHFTSYKSDENQLEKSGQSGVIKVEVDFLRSNCRVTNQPDFGNMFLHIEGKDLPTLESLAKYVVSHRQVSHFHEEIAEMTYMHLQKAFKLDKLMVACLYSRRGGIDINPVRASHLELIPKWFADPKCKIEKTLKQ